MSLAERPVSEKIEGFFAADPPKRLGVAVSGGGDSLALMLLLADWAESHGTTLCAATVDHGLRPEAAGEARFVAEVAAKRGIAHQVLRWDGWDGTGNLQDSARRARYGLLAGWARDMRLLAVALGHTRDDQAETFVMRLARSAGVDGLAAMPDRRRTQGTAFVRPLLNVGRGELRGWLAGRGQDWIEDPSNEDRGFERVRVRDAMASLEPLGITAKVLSEVSAHMASAREALEHYACREAQHVARVDRGDVILEREKWDALNGEIARRVLRAALMWIGGGDYPPRQAKLEQLMTGIAQGSTMTLAGCLVRAGAETVRISREAAAVRDETAPIGAIWDRRWRVTGPDEPGAQIRQLGEKGLQSCPGWRDSGLPYTSLAASPAVWRDETLLGAPLADAETAWQAELEGGDEGFFATFKLRGN